MRAEQIILALQQKDRQAPELFLQYYMPLMRYIVSPILKDERDAEECINQIALTVWEKIDTFDEKKGSFTTWLSAICRNLAVNMAKKQARHSGQLEMAPDMADTSPTPEQYVVAQETKAALKKAVASLSDKDQQLFYRKYYYRQSMAQIAAEMGLSLRAAEGRLYRIKKKLAAMIGGDDRG